MECQIKQMHLNHRYSVNLESICFHVIFHPPFSGTSVIHLWILSNFTLIPLHFLTNLKHNVQNVFTKLPSNPGILTWLGSLTKICVFPHLLCTAAMALLDLPPWSGPGRKARPDRLLMLRWQLISLSEKHASETKTKAKFRKHKHNNTVDIHFYNRRESREEVETCFLILYTVYGWDN